MQSFKIDIVRLHLMLSSQVRVMTDQESLQLVIYLELLQWRESAFESTGKGSLFSESEHVCVCFVEVFCRTTHKTQPLNFIHFIHLYVLYS